jgi:putative PIN family toxin of toxin-antitoxin system
MPTSRPNWRPTMPNVVLDTNTLVSAALRSGSIPDRALRFAVSQETILISAAVLLEYDEVLARPKFARILTLERRISFLALLSAVAIVIDAPEVVADCRDRKDNKFLDLALAGHADLIISGDNDLLDLDPWRGVRILTSASYVADKETSGNAL